MTTQHSLNQLKCDTILHFFFLFLSLHHPLLYLHILLLVFLSPYNHPHYHNSCTTSSSSFSSTFCLSILVFLAFPFHHLCLSLLPALCHIFPLHFPSSFPCALFSLSLCFALVTLARSGRGFASEAQPAIAKGVHPSPALKWGIAFRVPFNLGE